MRLRDLTSWTLHGPDLTASLGGEWHRISVDIRQLWHRLLYRSRPYRASLGKFAPTDLAVTPADPWPGDAARGQAILDGSFAFQGQNFHLPPATWEAVGASPAWAMALEGFVWLRDLRAIGSPAAQARARDLLADWLVNRMAWTPIGWRADVLGQRLAAWIGHYEYLVGDGPADLRLALLRAIALQARHLMRVALKGPAGALRISALKGLVYAIWCLPRPPKERPRDALRLRNKVMQWLTAELVVQIHPDGGHIERSPAVQLAVLRDLIEIRAVFGAARAEPPEALQIAIDRMAPFLRYMRHGDGGLALFNDTNEDEPWLIDTVLAQSDARGKPPATAPHSGFYRLAAGKSLILVDAGAPPAQLDAHAHAGTLSFEMSVGKERLIVNCGAHPADLSEWRRVQRATAAHSTVTIDDTNSSEILDGTALLPGALGVRAKRVTAERDEADGNAWLDLSHDGYVSGFGLLHRRRLFLAQSGDDLRGEETLVGQHEGRFAVRFHLHPRVQASLVQDASAALLRLPSGSGWRLRASGGAISLADSVYLGRRGEMKRAQQIVIAGRFAGANTVIKWALRRESAK